MKRIYAIYQCSREDFVKAAKKGFKLSSMPFAVNAFVVYCVTNKKEALNDCIKWNSSNSKCYNSITWFTNIKLY